MAARMRWFSQRESPSLLIQRNTGTSLYVVSLLPPGGSVVFLCPPHVCTCIMSTFSFCLGLEWRLQSGSGWPSSTVDTIGLQPLPYSCPG